MNANELAEQIEKHAQLLDNLTDFPKGVCDIKEAANMLRQQADRIAELEKVLKPIKCIVKDCENHKHEGGFTGDLCNPCYEFITTGKGIYSQAYRNTKTKPLSDEEIEECYWGDGYPDNPRHPKEFARAIEERHGIK